nr:ABC transporter permease [uncultured Blautia sp.]
MKKFWTVLRFELNNYFKSKGFVTATILLTLVLMGVIIVPTMIPGLLENDTASESSADSEDNDQTDTLGICVKTDQITDVDSLLSGMWVNWETYQDGESLKKAVKDKDVQAGFILNSLSDVSYVVNNKELYDSYQDAFVSTLEAYEKQQYLLEKGLTQEEIVAAENININVSTDILGKDSASNYWYTYILIFLVYFMIIFYGQMIATSVTSEKSNRAIEILVTSVDSNSLIFGKVLAGAFAGLLQALVILGGAFGAYGAVKEQWGGLLDPLFDIPASVFAAYAFFAIFSYLLYAFIFGALGALVSKTEDISKVSGPVTMLYVASFLVAIFGLNDCDGIMVKVASFIPFTSGNAMFIRVAMGSVAAWEVILSGGLLVASCVLSGLLAAKLFRYGTLHYGNPLKLTTALKNMKM